MYIANELNIIKFIPFQVKNITYKTGENAVELLFNPLKSIDIKKQNPYFLVIDSNQYNGDNYFTKKYCRKNHIDYYVPIFHWESMEVEKNQTEDLAENIYF